VISLDWLKNQNDNFDTLFYFMPPEHVISNLENNRVKVSEFSKCNDIFELSSFSMRSRNSRKLHKKWTEKVGEYFGLICLTTSWRNPLMWAHYAKNGAGVCLVFSVKKSDFVLVDYIDKRKERTQPFSFPTPKKDGKAFYQFCATKFSAWKYEKECRMFCRYKNKSIIKENNFSFKKFDRNFKLIGIINGPRPQLGMNELLKAADKKINYLQSRPAIRSFRVVGQHNKALWKLSTT